MSCMRGFGQSWFRLLSFAALTPDLLQLRLRSGLDYGEIAGVVTDASGAAWQQPPSR